MSSCAQYDYMIDMARSQNEVDAREQEPQAYNARSVDDQLNCSGPFNLWFNAGTVRIVEAWIINI